MSASSPLASRLVAASFVAGFTFLVLVGPASLSLAVATLGAVVGSLATFAVPGLLPARSQLLGDTDRQPTRS